MYENGVEISRMAVDNFLNPCEEDNVYPNIDLQTQALYVAGHEPPDELVEEEASETQFNVSGDLKVLGMASTALERLGLINNSTRETFLAA